MTRVWQPLGSVAPTDLVEPRLQLHRATQILGAAADQVLPAAPDHSHSSLSWSPDHDVLATQPLAPEGLRVALDVAGLRVAALRGDTVADRFTMHGATVEEVSRWVERVLRTSGVLPDGTSVPRGGLDLGEGPGSGTTPFTRGQADAFGELARWFGNAHGALTTARLPFPHASPVRCWPHHFDIAVLIPLDDGAGEDARSVGIGMTPGDDAYGEPYFYVTPWPYPSDAASLPRLDVGRWHTDGWTGAVLTASAITTLPSNDQEQLVRHYFHTAILHAAAVLAD